MRSGRVVRSAQCALPYSALANSSATGEHSCRSAPNPRCRHSVPITPYERRITLPDGFRLAMRVWTPIDIPRGNVVIAHGLGEHAGRYGKLASDLGDAGWEVHAADHRGHGYSPGERGAIPHPESIRDDIRASLTFARATSPHPTVLLGHSMGGAMAAWAVAHDPSCADALVLSSPALRTVLSAGQQLMLNTIGRLFPDLTVGNGLDADYLSHDAAVVAAYRNDPLVHDRISSRLARSIITAGEVTLAAAPAWRLPTIVLYAGADRIVNPRGSAEFAAAVRHPSSCAACSPSRRNNAPSSISLRPCAASSTRNFCDRSMASLMCSSRARYVPPPATARVSPATHQLLTPTGTL